MTTSNKTSLNRSVLSIHAKPETREKLDTLSKATSRTRSALANEAIEQYIENQEWLISEIEKGVVEADKGNLIPDSEVEKWLSSKGIT
jgi:RHH-type rel operon transcriptional repressor/antitoxin RelB